MCSLGLFEHTTHTTTLPIIQYLKHTVLISLFGQPGLKTCMVDLKSKFHVFLNLEKKGNKSLEG